MRVDKPLSGEICKIATKTTNHRKRWLLLLAKCCVSACLLAIILHHAPLVEIIDSLRQADVAWLILAAFSPALGLYLRASRWGCLLRSQQVSARSWTLIQSCASAGFVKQFLPSTIGGDALRAYDSWRMGASKSVALATIIMDRLLGFLPLALFGLIAVCFLHRITRDFPLLYAIIPLVFAILAGVIFILVVPSKKLHRLAQAVLSHMPRVLQGRCYQLLMATMSFQGRNRALYKAFFLSVLLQINVISFYYILGRAMGFQISYFIFFLIVPVAVFAMLAPISINGVGIRESIFIVLLSAFDIGSADAVAFAWLEHAIFLAYGLLGGFVFAFRQLPRRAADQTIASLDSPAA